MSARTPKGLMIAAPQSGSGKTLVTLGILAALSRRGMRVRGAKSGPDYIDGRFHEAASGVPSMNLDAWAMRADTIKHYASASEGALIVEAAMGLYDGAVNGEGSAAALARLLEIPVILVIDCSRQAQSAAALLWGFVNFPESPKIAGVILNRVGSDRHAELLRRAIAPLQLPVLGALPHVEDLVLPSRHLGLVGAQEQDLTGFFETATRWIEAHIDLSALINLGERVAMPVSRGEYPAPPGQSIAIAQDRAFQFLYPHFLKDWRDRGASITFFSPLNDESPAEDADIVILPGGYPELYAGRLAENHNFKSSLRKARRVFGECGGYMVMGEGLIDAEGVRHEMAGLLALETSFEKPKRQLGYRRLYGAGLYGMGYYAAHEFHYARSLSASGAPLFEAWDANGKACAPLGLRTGKFSGSFAHLIDWRADWQ